MGGKRKRNDEKPTPPKESKGGEAAASTIPAQTGPRKVTILSTKDIVPEVSGISSMALDAAEQRLAVARVNASIIVYRILWSNGIAHFFPVSWTGGREELTIAKVVWTARDEFLLAGTLSGQLIVYDPATLLPISVVSRCGGAIWDMMSVGDSGAFLAVADGTIRRYCSSAQDSSRLDLMQVFPKVSGADRATAVYVCEILGLVLAGDNAGNVSGWVLTEREVRTAHQKWLSRVVNGFPLVIVSCPEHAAVLVGTTNCEVVIFDALQGSILSVFCHHKGPVNCLCSFEGVVYASGWHESLRAYRYHEDRGWHPGEVKRRTHYHEATSLVIAPKSKLLLSASQDGTLMYTPVGNVFSAMPMYLDCHPPTFVTKSSYMLRFIEHRVEVFRFDGSRCDPFLSLRIAGPEFIKGVWATDDLSSIACATDSRCVVWSTGISSGASEGLKIRKVFEAAICGVRDMVLEEFPTIYFAAGRKIYLCDIPGKRTEDLALPHPVMGLLHVRGAVQNCLAIGTETTLHFLRLHPDKTFFGPMTSCDMPTLALYLTETKEEVIVHSVDGFAVAKPPTVTAPVSHLDARKPQQLTTSSVPPNAWVLQVSSNPKDRKAIAAFPRGLLALDAKRYRPLKKSVVEFAGRLENETVVVLERNVDGIVQQLPPMWRIRRFGN